MWPLEHGAITWSRLSRVRPSTVSGHGSSRCQARLKLGALRLAEVVERRTPAAGRRAPRGAARRAPPTPGGRCAPSRAAAGSGRATRRRSAGQSTPSRSASPSRITLERQSTHVPNTSKNSPRTIARMVPAVTRYDAVIVGGGHNGLVAAAFLARAGRSVLVLERRDHVGGAAVSERPWPGVDARLSRYSYLVSLLPASLAAELGIEIPLRRRAISSYTPRPDGTGLLVRTDEAPHDRWREFYAMTSRVGRRVFPTLTQPLPTREALRAEIAEDEAWEALFERPLGEAVDATFDDDVERGIALTDGLIGTFATAHDPSLQQNRCFLYHVIGNGDGHWDVPVGGMGAVTDALAGAARAAGAELRCGVEVTSRRAGRACAGTGGEAEAGHVLANVAPAVLAELLGEPPPGAPAGGRPAQAQHAARAAPAPARPGRGPARRVRGHLPRQRVGEPAPDRLRAGGRGAAARPAAVRDLLPLADRPEHPRPGAAGRGRPDADLLRAAHAGAPVRRRGGQGARRGGHAALAGRGARRADRGLPVAHARRRAVPGGAHAARSWRPSSRCRPGTSSTATSRGPTRSTRARPAGGASRRPTRGSCCAGPARGAAAGCQGSPAATPRWPSSRLLDVTVPFMNGWTRQ